MSLAWRTYAANEPRFVGTDRALLFGPGGTNLTANPAGSGATLGTPGALPAGWSLLAGLTLDAVTAQGVFRGVPWTEYQFSTAVATVGVLRIASFSLTDTLPYAGQIFMAYSSPPPAALTQTTFRIPTGVVTPAIVITPPTNGEVALAQGTWVANTTGSANLQLHFTTSAATTFRVRLGWNDLKQQAFFTNPIVAASGPAAIGADVMNRTLASLGIGESGASTWWFDWLPQADPQASEFPVSIDDGTTLNAFRIVRDVAFSVFFTRANGGAVLNSSAVAGVTSGVRRGVAFTVRGDGSGRLRIDGVGSAVETTGGPTSGLTTARLNGLSTSQGQSSWRSRRMQYLPYAVDDATLDTLAAQAAAW